MGVFWDNEFEMIWDHAWSLNIQPEEAGCTLLNFVSDFTCEQDHIHDLILARQNFIRWVEEETGRTQCYRFFPWIVRNLERVGYLTPRWLSCEKWELIQQDWWEKSVFLVFKLRVIDTFRIVTRIYYFYQEKFIAVGESLWVLSEAHIVTDYVQAFKCRVVWLFDFEGFICDFENLRVKRFIISWFA